MKIKEKKMFFNRYEFKKTKKLAEIDPYAGVEAYKIYLEKYPYDSSTYLYYVGLLITIGRLEEAETYLNKVKLLLSTKSIYKRDEEKGKMVQADIHFCTIKLLSYQNKVHELLKYCYDNFNEIKDLGPEIIFYHEVLAGVDYSKERGTSSYLYRQMIEYQEEDFKDHMKKHLAEYNKNDSNYSKNVFRPDFPIEKVFEEIKKYIPSDKKFNSGFIQNMYVFKYDECGYDNNKLVDYFVAIVFKNTCNFITMCPASGYEHYPHIDLNYLKEKKDIVEKTKVLSMIDKFNQRYKRNI